MEHRLEARQGLARPLAEVFEFFSDPGNLQKLTPPELGFEIVTQPIGMQAGALIDYRIRLWGMPLSWRTEITRWRPPHEFEDVQLRGPYRQWIHRHRFTDLGGGRTLMEDEVRYRLPLEPLGDLALPLVRVQLKRIFDYRRRACAERFGEVTLPRA